MKTQCLTDDWALVSESQGLWETLRILMGLPRILEEALEDPSWLGLNRWWFLTYNFPLSMITQEAFHSLREQQMSQWKIRWGREGPESWTWSGFALSVRSTGFESEPCQWSTGGHHLGFFSQTGEHAVPTLKAWRKKILSTMKISHLLIDFNSASLFVKGGDTGE